MDGSVIYPGLTTEVQSGVIMTKFIKDFNALRTWIAADLYTQPKWSKKLLNEQKLIKNNIIQLTSFILNWDNGIRAYVSTNSFR